MRNPQAWLTDDRALPPVGFEWLRGYTGHEHLDFLGIINIAARLYDPKMGRMLSVDNYVSDATSTTSIHSTNLPCIHHSYSSPSKT